MFQVTQEIIHQLALLPLLVMLVLLRTTAYSSTQWLIAAALALSWVMDSVWFVSGSSVLRYGMAIQLAVVLAAMGKGLAASALLGLTVALQGVTEPRDFVVPLVGGVLVCGYAWARETGLTRAALVIYFGLGGVAWAFWALLAAETTWYGYQFTRLAGLMLLTTAVVVHARRPQVKLV